MLPGERSSPRNLLEVVLGKGLARSFPLEKTAEHKCSLVYSILLHPIYYSISFNTQEGGRLLTS
jgi:hypothetical protein